METNDALLALSKDATDQAAWAFLYRRHWPYVYSIAYRILGAAKELSEDVTQETFFKLFLHCPAFDSLKEESFRAYVGTVARHTAISALRKERSIQYKQMHSTPGLEQIPEIPRHAIEVKEDVEALFASVRPQDRELLSMTLKGLSVEEISKQTNMTRNHLQVRLFRIRDSLRKRMER